MSKGDGNIMFIIIALVIAVVILLLAISFLTRGQETVFVSISEADFRNCCSNYLAAGRNSDATMCRVPEEADDWEDKDGIMQLTYMCNKLGRTGNCNPCL